VPIFSTLVLFAQRQMPDGPPPLIVTCICGGVVGFLCGLLPFFIGRYREQEVFGFVGLGCCTVGGLILGLLAAVPLAILIFAVTSIPMNWGSAGSRRRRPRPRRKPRRDDPDEDEDPIARRIRRRDEDEDDRPRRGLRDERGITRLPELDEEEGNLDQLRELRSLDEPRRRRRDGEEEDLDDLPELRGLDEPRRRKRDEDE
jgi:hypothetical protein